MSSLPICEMGVALPSFATGPNTLPPTQGLLGDATPGSILGGDLLQGFSVFLSAAGTPMAVLGWYMP